MTKIRVWALVGVWILLGMASAHAADGVTIPLGDWVVGVASWLLPIAGTVLMAVLTTVAGKIAPWAVQYLKTQAVEQLLGNAVNFGLNAVEGAAKGKTLDVTTGNAVLNEALGYAIAKGPSAIISWLGGPDGISHMLLARLPLDESASAAKLGVTTP